MNESEKKAVVNELIRHWPMTFQDDELERWADKLCVHALYDVTEVLSVIRAESSAKPALDEVCSKLPATLNTSESRRRLQRYRTATARNTVAKNPDQFGKPEPVILLLAYRSIFKKYAADRALVKRHNVDVLIAADALRFARECAVELSHVGFAWDVAQEIGAYISADDGEFEQRVREVGATGHQIEKVNA